MKSFKKQSVDLRDIDFENISYKLSRISDNVELKRSIAVSGILDPPVLHKGSGLYTIVSGFNRLGAARDLGINVVDALVCSSLSSSMILAIAHLKEYHNEIGPAGKARLIDILISLQLDGNIIRDSLSKEFGVPDYIIGEPGLRKFLLGLPLPLLKYIDGKNINFKLLKKLHTLPHEVVEMISSWIAYSGLKVNIFRSLIDMVEDIYRRDSSVPLFKFSPGDGDKEIKEFEEELHSFYFSLRYPRFSSKLQEAEKLRHELAYKGLGLNFPHNFEGSTLSLSVNIPVDADPQKIFSRISKIDEDLISSLQKVLK